MVLAVDPPVEPSVDSPAAVLVWSVGAGTDVGVAAPAAEVRGWQAARVADSISAARAAPAFRVVRGSVS